MAKGGLEYSDFKKFHNQLLRLQRGNDDFILRLSNQIGLLLLRRLVQLTPVGVYDDLIGESRTGGQLRRSWRIQKATKQVKAYAAVVYNQAEYAFYVEYGHRQQPGRYVPALGKRLKRSWVTGRFMLTKAQIEVEQDLPQLVLSELLSCYGGIFHV